MHGANKRTGNLPKRLKLVTDEVDAGKASTNESSDNDTVHERSVVDKTSSCEPVGDDPITEPATLESTNNPTATEPNIMEPQEVLGEDTPREQYNGVMAGSALSSPVDDGGEVLGGNLSALTDADGLAILDEYFPKSATGLGPLSGVLGPEPPMPPARVALSGSPGVWTTPGAGQEVDLPKKPEIPYPEPPTDSVEACGSISHSASSESVSSTINPTRCPSYETNATDIDSMDVAIHPPFAKRAALDDGPQLLEHVLVALDSAYDDRRAPTLCVPGVIHLLHATWPISWPHLAVSKRSPCLQRVTKRANGEQHICSDGIEETQQLQVSWPRYAVKTREKHVHCG
jgi:hypothetical protein